VAAPDLRLASVIVRLREERGMTQEDLAYASGVSIGALSRIERGLNDPHWTTFVLLAAGLGLSLVELVRAIEAEPG
jgi:transcriptional regulator with XRE-family HTH domain